MIMSLVIILKINKYIRMEIGNNIHIAFMVIVIVEIISLKMRTNHLKYRVDALENLINKQANGETL